MGSVPPAEAGIPVIDISSQNANAAKQLLDAAANYGFVFIENNEVGISYDAIANMFDLSRGFFALPVELKQEVAINSAEANKNHGWLSRGVEKLDPATQKAPDVKEALNIGEHHSGELQQPMPDSLRPSIQTVIDFQDACHELCLKLFERFAEALDIDRHWFTARHDRNKGASGTVLRLLYYPKVETIKSGVDIRAGAHSDFGSVTLLFQLPGQPGLEIRTPSGDWAAVPVDPHPAKPSDGSSAPRPTVLPILVNIGDLLEDWTGGLLKSTVHRVIFPDGTSEDRYSIAYFCQPLDDARLEPVPSKLVESYAARTGKTGMRDGRAMTSKEHLSQRLAATYSIK